MILWGIDKSTYFKTQKIVVALYCLLEHYIHSKMTHFSENIETLIDSYMKVKIEIEEVIGKPWFSSWSLKH